MHKKINGSARAKSPRTFSFLLLKATVIALGCIGSAQAQQHRVLWAAKPAPPVSARDGISGNGMVRAGAHGVLGGAAVGRPTAIGSVNRKLRR